MDKRICRNYGQLPHSRGFTEIRTHGAKNYGFTNLWIYGSTEKPKGRNHGVTNLRSVAVELRSHRNMELRTHGSPFLAKKILPLKNESVRFSEMRKEIIWPFCVRFR